LLVRPHQQGGDGAGSRWRSCLPAVNDGQVIEFEQQVRRPPPCKIPWQSDVSLAAQWTCNRSAAFPTQCDSSWLERWPRQRFDGGEEAVLFANADSFQREQTLNPAHAPA